MPLKRRDFLCAEAVQLVTDYFEGALSWRQRRLLEHHVKACQDCKRYLDQLQTTIRVAGHIDPETLEPETRDELVDLYRRYRGA